MDRSTLPRLRVSLTLAVAATMGGVLAWQHFKGGVPSHSFMARDDMPSISNWWGVVTLPLLTWFALGNVAARLAAGRVTERAAIGGALGALLFGLVLAVSYEIGFNVIPGMQVRILPLIALLLPIYRAEYLLGFVLALAYTFGGVLPIILGSVFAAGGAVIHLMPRWLLRRFRKKA